MFDPYFSSKTAAIAAAARRRRLRIARDTVAAAQPVPDLVPTGSSGMGRRSSRRALPWVAAASSGQSTADIGVAPADGPGGDTAGHCL
ncbi:hypothetical protein BFF78_02280 [Streptomyces fodineus]|uniref:Uncharacterized protein n=1 Tax=Streptomyces fodineus TaxID=1904616 RepID=A0A1D7Y394_9ACTN|nr:hypothetical protein [Streptomyces fodineus]AOR30053.1 hypothetical protein BFF78_02280 [Streptomyces fodineus]